MISTRLPNYLGLSALLHLPLVLWLASAHGLQRESSAKPATLAPLRIIFLSAEESHFSARSDTAAGTNSGRGLAPDVAPMRQKRRSFSKSERVDQAQALSRQAFSPSASSVIEGGEPFRGFALADTGAHVTPSVARQSGELPQAPTPRQSGTAAGAVSTSATQFRSSTSNPNAEYSRATAQTSSFGQPPKSAPVTGAASLATGAVPAKGAADAVPGTAALETSAAGAPATVRLAETLESDGQLAAAQEAHARERRTREVSEQARRERQEAAERAARSKTTKETGTTSGASPLSQPYPEIPEALLDDVTRRAVRVRFSIDEGGAARAEVTSSSGSSEVDAIVLRACNRWKFKPALRNGQPRASTLNLRVEIR